MMATNFEDIELTSFGSACMGPLVPLGHAVFPVTALPWHGHMRDSGLARPQQFHSLPISPSSSPGLTHRAVRWKFSFYWANWDDVRHYAAG